ncbi:hypothetical protein K7X08_005362 [Anisodus acutangulus]|uniref:Uncharacterized protein n=1 Tax=Anisodus acutangulus TaxID=402998 RepID=A0A9Q1R6S3_9SOLA|nr:hypothetical protein K7X08_005362 [Anisodus acutangulus]
MDKSYVFLICNGIFLVLLAKTFGEEEEEEEEEDHGTKNGFLNEFQEAELPLCIDTQASYLETSNEEVHVRHEDEELLSIKLSECHRPSLNVTLVEYEATSEGQILDKEKEEDGIGGEDYSRTYDVIEADNCEENDEMDPENDFLLEEEEEQVVDESEEPLNKLSTEELNKKFEEFIRKMKEEIRIEARQQLVLVKQAADVAKVELPRPATDVPVKSIKVVNGTDVLDQVISEEVFFNSEKVVMGVVDQLNDS